jgi:ATP-dependent DNA helicase RecQ
MDPSDPWPALRKSILRRFQLEYLYPHQELAVHYLLGALGKLGRTELEENCPGLFICLPTGSGKSICFMGPAAELCEGETGGISLILYPLNALLRDQQRKFARAEVPAVLYCGALDSGEKSLALEAIRKMDRGVVLSNAESASRGPLLPLLTEKRVRFLVIDEAHLILQWGGSFRPDLLRVIHIRMMLDNPVTAACTATISDEQRRELATLLWPGETWERIELLCDRPNISYRVISCRDGLDGIKALLYIAAGGSGITPEEMGIEEELCLPAIVFVANRRLCEELAQRARIWFRRWIGRTERIWHYHAGLDTSLRREIESDYAAAEDGLVFSTKAFGTGLDLPNVRCCIHFDPPETMEDFLQESGRAGRDGKPAASILLQIRRRLFKAGECRRRAALARIDQEPEHCAGCDVCNGTEREEPIEDILIGEFRRRHRIRGYLEDRDLLRSF